MAAIQESISPGPDDTSLLTLQAKHRSDRVWRLKDDQQDLPLDCRRCEVGMWTDIFSPHRLLDRRILHHMTNAGFYGVYRVGHIQLDHALITALVSRWRPETHTFHLPVGEATVTLQDVQILYGLPVDGLPVMTSAPYKSKEAWSNEVADVLGASPEASNINNSYLNMNWLCTQFQQLPSDATDHMTERYAKAYLLLLIGGSVLSDKTSGKVRLHFLTFLRDLQKVGDYSWGSACLATLYRSLCRASVMDMAQVGGPLLLLQIWAWERIAVIRPFRLAPIDDMANDPFAHSLGLPRRPWACRWSVPFSFADTPSHVLRAYRYSLDTLTADQFIWEPYTTDVLGMLDAYCTRDRRVWFSRVPLICIEVVEWHLPDRVTSQFGVHQRIPVPPGIPSDHHELTRQGHTNTDWVKFHAVSIDACSERHDKVITGTEGNDGNYMTWYRNVTRRIIQNPQQGCSSGFRSIAPSQLYLGETLGRVYHHLNDAIQNFHLRSLDDHRQLLITESTRCKDALQVSGLSHYIEHTPLEHEPHVQHAPMRSTRCRGRRQPRATAVYAGVVCPPPNNHTGGSATPSSQHIIDGMTFPDDTGPSNTAPSPPDSHVDLFTPHVVRASMVDCSYPRAPIRHRHDLPGFGSTYMPQTPVSLHIEPVTLDLSGTLATSHVLPHMTTSQLSSQDVDRPSVDTDTALGQNSDVTGDMSQAHVIPLACDDDLGHDGFGVQVQLSTQDVAPTQNMIPNQDMPLAHGRRGRTYKRSKYSGRVIFPTRCGTH